MKRKITRLLSIMLVLVMAMSLMACGSKKSTKTSKNELSELTAEELVTKVSSASQDIKGVSATANVDVAVSLSGMEMSAEGALELKSNIDPSQTYSKINLTIDALGEKQDINAETYEIFNDDKIDSYSLVDGEWSYTSIDASEYADVMSDLTSSLESIDYSMVSEYFDKIEASSKDGNYELTMTVTTEKLLSKLEELGLTKELGDIDLSVVPDATVTLKSAFDGKTYLPVSTSMAVEMDPIEYQGTKIELTTFIFDMTFDSYDSVDITVPKEALAAK